MVPGKVELQEKVIQVSAGDSHTAALTEDGRVFLWGSFRVSLVWKTAWDLAGKVNLWAPPNCPPPCPHCACFLVGR
jgi:alpha-tubulin suppressor-like RCC1 family protein